MKYLLPYWLLIALSVTVAREAGAVMFNVNLTQDKVDAVPGDGICSYNALLDPDEHAVCTLRAAIMEGNATAQGTVEIVLTAGATYKLTITDRNEDAAKKGDLDVRRPMNIGVAEGANGRAKIDANALDRAVDFHQDAGQNTLHGIEIINGIVGDPSQSGSAIRTRANSLTLENMDIHHCPPLGENTIVIHSGGGLFLLDSRIHHNGDDLHSVNAIHSHGATQSVTLIRSTVDHNSGQGISTHGGSLFVHSSTISSNNFRGIDITDSSATIVNSTIASNGFAQITLSSPLPQHSTSLFLAGSLLQSGENCYFYESAGKIKSDTLGNTFSGDSCSHGGGIDEKNINDATILLSPLDDWGGSTPTHKLLPGSDGIDRIDLPLYVCNQPGVDQRGLPRPVASNGSPMPYCDSGAVELQPADLTPPEDPEDPPAGPIFADGFDML